MSLILSRDFFSEQSIIVYCAVPSFKVPSHGIPLRSPLAVKLLGKQDDLQPSRISSIESSSALLRGTVRDHLFKVSFAFQQRAETLPIFGCSLVPIAPVPERECCCLDLCRLGPGRGFQSSSLAGNVNTGRRLPCPASRRPRRPERLSLRIRFFGPPVHDDGMAPIFLTISTFPIRSGLS